MIEFDLLEYGRGIGEVWSQGPLPNTLWVLDPVGGSHVVDYVTWREVAYAEPSPREMPSVARRGAKAPRINEKTWRDLVSAGWLEEVPEQLGLFPVA